MVIYWVFILTLFFCILFKLLYNYFVICEEAIFSHYMFFFSFDLLCFVYYVSYLLMALFYSLFIGEKHNSWDLLFSYICYLWKNTNSVPKFVNRVWMRSCECMPNSFTKITISVHPLDTVCILIWLTHRWFS